MKTKHTPGPWTRDGGNISGEWETGEQVTIAITGVTRFCGDESGGPRDTRMKAENKANARLIAAAPELLAALKNLHALIDTNALIESYNCKGKAANAKIMIAAVIAKAEGE